MVDMRRRTVLAGVGGLAVGGGMAAPAAAAPAGRTGRSAELVRPGDPRYPELMTGNNQRFVAHPEYVAMITDAAEAEAAVRDAVRAGKRVSVRSGGHCFSDFVCNPQIEVVLDLSLMTDISYDPHRRAFAVQPGARLINVYEELFKTWNVTLPGGICYSVGIGGHVAGGGYGLLSRAHGLICDHLYAVEVVVVDQHGRVRTVVATRDAGDPNRELWWAHAGGGGGNFGVVTRYWFRSPGVDATTPQRTLIAPPSTVLVSALAIPWDGLSGASFARLLKNFGGWHEANSAPGSPFTSLSSLFNVSHRSAGSMGVFTQVDAAAPGADAMLASYLTALLDGVGVTPQPLSAPSGELPAMPELLTPRRMPWLQATKLVGTNNPIITDPTARGAHKSAYMRRNFTDAHVAAVHRGMTAPEYDNPNAMLVLFSYGGKVGDVRSDATALPQRDSVFKMCFQTFWKDAAQDGHNLGWARRIYGDFFADSGGVPVPGPRTDGCYINYPDNDVADPAFNRSGVPWHTLYYKQNYPRLQAVKQRWDPSNYFRHALSVRPPGQ